MCIRDRKKAFDLAQSGKVDSDGRVSVFGQCFRQLSALEVQRLRSKAKAFSVIFRGESGEDAGGVYREAMEHMCKELQSGSLPLFVRCPNSVQGVGVNRDKWLPNPSADNEIQLSMFEFLGQLLGIALRTKNLLSLDWPPLVWKALVATPVGMSDLRGVDLCVAQALDTLYDLEGHGVTREVFTDYFDETFVTRNSAGDTVELCGGGAARAVTYENHVEFADAMERYRLQEATQQIAAIRRGMATVVPCGLLSLFTHRELEMHIAGCPVMDLSLLRSCTTYSSGASEDDPHVQGMWEALENFSEEQRCMFLRFVWGYLLYTSDAADEEDSVDLGGRGLIKKKKKRRKGA
eukprot:TRINITY_DN18650_c0_g1_i1.p1 TRINITY_DN18650_c0_g1~~TRINITY_DN18650_c0_g1_i1.p1  ORF type:complete len:349 (+),score=105.86 TRINITY_DN18650_c0_g1_i1:128-1174(+)